ncbi:MAG: hypothetical protein ACRDD1_14795, partial [Planctomycetia bacterium]
DERRRLGDVPVTGEWTRLEVPAAALGLVGKRIHGVAFTHQEGRALWASFGALPEKYRVEDYFSTTATYPMKHATGAVWAGKFPLDRDGYYRVEMRTASKHANKPMKEARITALPDAPPQVSLERPNGDLTLSTPAKVPLVIAARDDYGLAGLVVSVQRRQEEGFVGKPVKTYDVPVRNDDALAQLDLVEMDLKKGESIRYRVEARDRKGQSAQTKEFSIRIGDDHNAADKQLQQFAEKKDIFEEKLSKLVAEQKAVREETQKLAEKFQPLAEKVKKATAEVAKAEAAKAADPKSPPPPTDPIVAERQQTQQVLQKLDPEAQRDLQQLRQELQQTANREAQNSQLANQVTADVGEMVREAEKLQLLPPELTEEFKAAQDAFKEQAADPLADLTQQLQKSVVGDQ